MQEHLANAVLRLGRVLVENERLLVVAASTMIMSLSHTALRPVLPVFAKVRALRLRPSQLPVPTRAFAQVPLCRFAMLLWAPRMPLSMAQHLSAWRKEEAVLLHGPVLLQELEKDGTEAQGCLWEIADPGRQH